MRSFCAVLQESDKFQHLQRWRYPFQNPSGISVQVYCTAVLFATPFVRIFQASLNSLLCRSWNMTYMDRSAQQNCQTHLKWSAQRRHKQLIWDILLQNILQADQNHDFTASRSSPRAAPVACLHNELIFTGGIKNFEKHHVHRNARQLFIGLQFSVIDRYMQLIKAIKFLTFLLQTKQPQ